MEKLKLLKKFLHDPRGAVDLSDVIVIIIGVFLMAILGGAALNYMYNATLVPTTTWDPTVKLVVMTLVPVMAFLGLALLFIFAAIQYTRKGKGAAIYTPKLFSNFIHDVKGAVDLSDVIIIIIAVFLTAILGGAALNYLYNATLVNTTTWDPTTKLVMMTLAPVMAFLALALMFIFAAIKYTRKGKGA
jgi:glycerol uptake facilitator-like aquaporin